jgi:hypothetical protein
MSMTVIEYLVLTNEDWVDTLELTTLAEDEEDDPAPVDLTGSSFAAHIRTSPDALNKIVIATTGNGRLVVAEPANGLLAWNIPAEEMAVIEPGVYFYDIVWTSADGIIDTIAAGHVTVQRGVTRP